MKSQRKVCTVNVEVAGASHSLGEFTLLPAEGGSFFDYYALAEELVNRGLIEDEDEAARVCDCIEHKYNEEHKTEGVYVSESGTVTVTFTIAPITG